MTSRAVLFQPTGSLGEQPSWRLELGYLMEADRDEPPADSILGRMAIRPCRHAVEVTLGVRAWDQRPLVRWRVPHVVVVDTQAGFDHTVVCADCVREAVAASTGTTPVCGGGGRR